ncbi:hypothetical protein [Borreliella andersonii]|uniref:hypothetical protein n=1 Tax=Borrelia andersonii TaxID=42109 RepID=UPI003AB7B5DD
MTKKDFNDEICCLYCNKLIEKDAEICVACGANKQNKKSYYGLIAFLFCLGFIYLGLHNFYVGKTKIGLSFLFISIFSFLLVVLYKLNKTK